MIGKSLVDAVHKEAGKLRQHATQDERELLDIDTFDPQNAEQCIYGQMARFCRSNRAIKLLQQCAPTAIDIKVPASNVECKLPRAAKKGLSVSKTSEKWVWSPIEVYIAQKGADNEQLIDYLKGKIDTLDLSGTINC